MITRRQREQMLMGYGDILTVKEVMEVLHLGEKTVRKMLREGIISSLFFGEQYIIPKVYLIDFLTDENNLAVQRKKVWTSERSCGIVCVPAKDAGKRRQKQSNSITKGGESA